MKTDTSHWLGKSEPSAYSWADLVRDGKTAWTGVRNFQARKNLRAMKKGDLVFFYQSVTAPAVMGISNVVQEAYPEPITIEGDWSCVDLEHVNPLLSPVTLASIKGDPSLAEISLIRQSRLSVMPVTKKEFELIVKMGGKN
jgi:predicted RNA-binding protein with PUA-like domain